MLSFPAVTSAQDAVQDTTAPPHVSVAEGAATLEREGQSETAVAGMPFVPGDRLQTTRGRVELLYDDGTALSIDEFSTIELLDKAILRLTAGRILLHVVGVNDPANAVRYQIDTPSASAITDGPGEYRVALLNGGGVPETELAVFRGYASLSTDVGSTAVRAGERTLARDLLAPSHPLPFNAARFDAFERWVATRRDARLGTASSQYIPRDLYAYSSTFDRYGAWMHEGSYGYVWYPSVAVGWRPYHHGYWSPLRRYGWTWIGHDPWGWPTHHYGRWGFARGRWFWVPGRTWGPAWVSWASAPGFVGWCPLGFDGRPVFGLSVSVGNPWNGWVVVSRPHFGRRYAVHQYALPPASIPARTPFVVHTKAPLDVPAGISAPRAVPRPVAAAPSQRAGSRAVPRGSTVIAPQATPDASPSSATGRARAAQRAGSGGRITDQTAPRGVAPSDAPSSATRYVPETRMLGGRRAAARARAGAAAEAPASEVAPPAAAPRWYPPVTMARPRVGSERATPNQASPDQAPPAGSQPRWGPAASGPPRSADAPGAIQRSAPPAAPTDVPRAAPWTAQPRRPAGAAAGAGAAPQSAPPRAEPPPRASEPAAAARSAPRGPVAAPRSAPRQQDSGQQGGQSSGGRASSPSGRPPAGARSPR
jgi:hypothetical protein